jgi:hypothetical protein
MMSRLLRGLCCLTMVFAHPGHAENVPVPEYALKSALLFKLPHFVYRPEIERNIARNTPLAICLLGNNSFGNALEKLAVIPVAGRSVRLQYLESPDAVAGCEFVFISRSEASRLKEVLRQIGTYPAVTVSDIAGFANSGGMVELALGAEGTAITLLINRRAGQRLGIEFSAQLLRLSKVVEP